MALGQVLHDAGNSHATLHAAFQPPLGDTRVDAALLAKRRGSAAALLTPLGDGGRCSSPTEGEGG